MKLHENKNLFQDAIAATATLKGLREIHIEKDYWVTLALYTIFTGEMGNQVAPLFTENCLLTMILLRHYKKSLIA